MKRLLLSVLAFCLFSISGFGQQISGVPTYKQITQGSGAPAGGCTGPAAFIDAVGHAFYFCDGTWHSGAGASGLTSLDSLTAATQTLATGYSGTAPNIVSATSTHTFNSPANVIYPTAATGAAIQACINAVLAAGKGTCDARSVSGAVSATQITGAAGVTVLQGASNITCSLTPCIIPTDDFQWIGLGGRGGTSQLTSASGGTVIASTDGVSTHQGFILKGVQINTIGASSIGLDLGGLTSATIAENFFNLGPGGSNVAISCTSATLDATYELIEKNRIQLNSATDNAFLKRNGHCNAWTMVENRISGNSVANTQVLYGNSGDANQPNEDVWIGNQLEGSPGGKAFSFVKTNDIRVYGGRCEAVGTCVSFDGTGGSLAGIYINTPYFSSANTTQVNSGIGLMFSTETRGNNFTRDWGWGWRVGAGRNLLSDGIIESWINSTTPLVWTATNSAVLTQVASSGYSYPTNEGGSAAMRVGDGSVTAWQGVLDNQCIVTDPNTQYTGDFDIAPVDTAKIRIMVGEYSDTACATKLTTGSSNINFTDTTKTNGAIVPGGLSYNASAGFHVDGSDITVTGGTTLQNVQFVFRPVSTAKSMKIGVVTSVAGTTNQFIVDNFRVCEGACKAALSPSTNFLADSGPGGSIPVNAKMSFGGGSPWFDVKYFGAKGDDTTDDTAAIQAALNAADAVGGAVVYLPAGKYKACGLTGAGKGVTVEGEGPSGGGPGTNPGTNAVTFINCYTNGGGALTLGTQDTFSYNGPVVRNIGFKDKSATGAAYALKIINQSYAVVEKNTWEGFHMAGVSAPSAPTVAASAGNGYPTGTYYVVVTYQTAAGRSLPSAQASVSISSCPGGTGTTCQITVTSPAASGNATAYDGWIGTVSGGPYYLQVQGIGTGPTPLGTNLVLSTLVSSGAKPPKFNLSAGTGLILQGTYGDHGNTSAFQNQTKVRDNNCYLGTINCTTNYYATSFTNLRDANYNMGTNTTGCALIDGGPSDIQVHFENAGSGWSADYACATGFASKYDLEMETISGGTGRGLVGISLIKAYIEGSCANFAASKWFVGDSASIRNRINVRSNGSCGSPMISDADTTNSNTKFEDTGGAPGTPYWKFGVPVYLPSDVNQVSANSDFAGTLTCSGGTVTKTFSTAFVSTPVVILSDETTAGGARVSAKSASAFTVTCTGATDVVDYLTMGNPN